VVGKVKETADRAANKMKDVLTGTSPRRLAK